VEVRSVWVTNDKVAADRACEDLRAHGIKCDIIEPTTPYVPAPYTFSGAQVNVVVAPDDEERANDVLGAWADSLNLAFANPS